MLKNPQLLLTIPSFAAGGFLMGLILGSIPTAITQKYGLRYVGLVTPIFHFTLSFSGFYAGKISDQIGRFSVLYLAIVSGLAAAAIILLAKNILLLALAMLLIGFFSAAKGVVLSVLLIDIFKEKVKEAQAASGSIGAALGVIPAFVLNKYFSITQLLYLAIFLCLLDTLSLRILEVKLKKTS